MDAGIAFNQGDAELFDGSFNKSQLEIVLINAICKNDVELLTKILEYGVDPSFETSFFNNFNHPSDEWRAVHIAAVKGKLECLKVLVKCGAKTSILLGNGTKIFSLAENRGHTECVTFLKQVEEQENRDIEQQIHSLKDLEQACSDGVPVNTLNMLLNALLNNCNPLHWKFENGDSPIVAACRTGNLDKIAALVRRGSPALYCMRRSDNRYTPLHAACEHEQIKVVYLLLYFWPQLLNMKSSEGASALLIAVTCLHVRVIEELIRIASSRENYQDFITTYKPPIEDCERKHCDIIPSLEINAQDNAGNTALHRAIFMKSPQIVNILTNLDELDLDIKNSSEHTPLHLAIEGKLYDIVDRLLVKKANTKIKSYFQTSHYYPLTVATLLNDIEMLKVLLKNNIHHGLQEASKFAIDKFPDLLVTLLSYNTHIDEELLDDTSDRYVDANLRRPEFAIFCNFAKYSLRDLHVDTLTEALLSLSQKLVITIPGISIPRQDLLLFVTKVDLSNNSLKALPDCFFSLRNLFNLDLSFNTIFNFVPQPDQWLQLSYLSLANNKLKTLSPEIFKLPQLRYFNANNNELLNLPRQMWIAPVLNKLMLKNNMIQNLPQDIPVNVTSHSLQFSRASDNSNTPISGEQKFHSRTTIFTKGLHFDFTKTTSCLPKALTHLNLAENIITELPEELPCLCPDLQVLNLSCNKLTAVSFPMCFPQSLLDLNLSNNKITSINCTQEVKLKHKCARIPIGYSAPEELEDLTCNHRSHSILTRLSRLDLSKNKLNTLNLYPPEKGDKQTEQQQGRIASENKKKKDKHLVCPLLTCIYLSNNELEQVPESVCDTRSLTSLNINGNPILELPPKLGQLSNLFQLDRTGLQLVFPPQNILDKNVKDIIGFLWSLQKDAKPYHRIRLMLVGMQNRGKSSLLSRLSEKGTYRSTKSTWQLQRRPKTSNNSKVSIATPGISISEWTYMPKMRRLFYGSKNSQLDLQAITFMVWDFGGQDEFQPTHQCFLSKRSIYLVLWNLTYKEKGIDELKGWLLNIQARAPNAPVLIVGTHLDLLSKAEKQEIPQMRKSIIQKYGHVEFKQKPGLPNILSITEVSTLTNDNVDELRDSIYYSASHLTVNGTLYNENDKTNNSRQKLLMDQLIPSAYLQMEDCIRKMALSCARDEMPRIMEESVFFENLSQVVKNLLNSDDVTRDMEHALKFLHDNGFLLHYEDAQLKDLYFIDPQWLCDLLAQVVTVREINPYIREDGLMAINSMYHLFSKQKDFPPKYIEKYIQLLVKFEVVLKLDEETLLIPSFLQENRPEIEYFSYADIDYLPPIKTHIMVDYIPGGFWARLITRVLSDEAIKEAVVSGCAPVAVTEKIKWVKWRNGLELSCKLEIGEICLAKLYEKQKDQLGFRREERKAWIMYEAEFEEYTAREFETYALMLEIPDNFPTLLKYNTEQGQVVERMQDMMRATLLTKLTYHTKVLIDDWYHGMSPAKILISCPFCQSKGQTEFKRYRGTGEIEISDPIEAFQTSERVDSFVSDMQELDKNLENAYFFTHEHILVQTQKSVYLECPNHGKLPLSIVAPDAIFTHLGTELLIHPKKLTICKLLGRGAYGRVYKGRICSDCGPVRGCMHGEGVAVKMMVKYNEQRIEEAIAQLQDLSPKLNNFGLQNETKINFKVYEEVTNAHDVVFKEASYLLSLKNPYVVSLIGICLFPISLILELAPMSSLENLLDEYDKRGLRLSQVTCHQTILLITKGLRFIHKKNVIYRDLKASNVLVWKFPLPTDAEGASTDVSLKISDYGVSQFANFGGIGWAGTPGYMAPEIVSHVGSQLYTTKVDIFSLGMTIYEVITLHPPFANLQDIAANQEVVNNNRPLLATKDTTSSILMRELMVWCWQQDPAKRPSAEQVHEVLNSWEFLALQGGIKVFNKGVITCASVFSINEASVPDSPIQSFTSRDVIIDIARQKSGGSDMPRHDNYVTLKIDTNEIQMDGNMDAVANKPVRSALKKKIMNPTISLGDCLIRTESIQESKLLDTPNKQIWEIWVCGGGKYNSELSVLKYKDKFTSIEDIYLGSAACTCLRKVNGQIWVGFEEGFIQIFNASSRKLRKKIWIEPGIPVIQIEWVSQQSMALVVLANGNIFEHPDNADEFESNRYESSLFPFINQLPSIALATAVYSAVSVHTPGVGRFLWLGVEEGNILTVNTNNWTVEEIKTNLVTKKAIPPCVHLVTMPSKSLIFGSLSYTTKILKWNAESMEFQDICDISSFKNIGKGVEDARVITNIHADSCKVYVGLNVGTMLILSTDLEVLASYYGHEGSLSQILTLNLAEEETDGTEYKKKVFTFGLNYHRYFSRKKQMEDESPQNLLVWELGGKCMNCN